MPARKPNLHRYEVHYQMGRFWPDVHEEHWRCMAHDAEHCLMKFEDSMSFEGIYPPEYKVLSVRRLRAKA